MTVELGGTYSEPGATSNGGETVTITGSVDTATARNIHHYIYCNRC